MGYLMVYSDLSWSDMVQKGTFDGICLHQGKFNLSWAITGYEAMEVELLTYFRGCKGLPQMLHFFVESLC